jgi:hypothetical protein
MCPRDLGGRVVGSPWHSRANPAAEIPVNRTNRKGIATVRDEHITQLIAASNLVTVSDYLSFVGADKRRRIAFAIDTNRDRTARCEDTRNELLLIPRLEVLPICEPPEHRDDHHQRGKSAHVAH